MDSTKKVFLGACLVALLLAAGRMKDRTTEDAERKAEALRVTRKGDALEVPASDGVREIFGVLVLTEGLSRHDTIDISSA